VCTEVHLFRICSKGVKKQCSEASCFIALYRSSNEMCSQRETKVIFLQHFLHYLLSNYQIVFIFDAEINCDNCVSRPRNRIVK
jgi:uncharacterized protein with von Willebrand factor type A (vWA) domain